MCGWPATTTAGAKRHREQIREALKFRPATLDDEERLTAWLAVEVCPVELVEDRQREALLVECRARKIEPPGRTRIEKVLVAARNRWEKVFCARTIERLGDVGVARLLALVAEDNEDGAGLLALLKRDPGAVGLDSLLTEITKLNDVRRLGLTEGLFADGSEKLLAAWRSRAIKMYPSDFRDTAEDARITLLEALCSSRQAEINDALVELLVALVHKINARAERRVEKQLTAELKKVGEKEGILFKLADAAIGKPDEVVREALYPVVGEKTLRDRGGEGEREGLQGQGPHHPAVLLQLVLPADAAAAAEVDTRTRPAALIGSEGSDLSASAHVAPPGLLMGTRDPRTWGMGTLYEDRTVTVLQAVADRQEVAGHGWALDRHLRPVKLRVFNLAARGLVELGAVRAII
ncbi:hypothetical protein ABT330_06615 [Streptomyces sp. NPDC000658]|uniref:hypothetical protein n=1 Tax=Streptomyces sp. NPDC000658 TaxID=3154266 RepID=UPI00332EF006